MKIDVEKRNNIPGQVEDYVVKRAKRLEKYVRENSSMKCVISHQKGNFLVEITLQDLGNTFQAHASSNDLEISINEGLQKIEHQFKKFKERLTNRKKISNKEVFSEKEKKPNIKTRKIKPLLLFLDEAINEFDNSKEPFFVFVNKETERPSIVHKAKNGDYHIIEL